MANQKIPDNSGSQSTGPSIQSLPPFTFVEVTERFISAQLRSLKASKLCGLENISPRLFKDSAEIIAKPLTKIINLCLSLSTVPRNWKSARVVPLYKKGNSNDMDNYRPISVLPVACKLLERAVQRQLYQYLTEHQLFSTYQCGFRKNHSTESAAISFTDSIGRGMDQGLLTGSVFIDLRKAFDTVDHYILLRKLGNYCIYDRAELALFANYLKDRSQLVCHGNESSNPCTITSGVPQFCYWGVVVYPIYK